MLKQIVLLIACVWAVTIPALAQKRVALVIGNAAYKETPPLNNPRNDAADMIEALKRLGFDVLDGLDLDKRGMERLIRQFEQKLAGADVGLFFYAGHGIQISGQNHLVPTDARLAAEGDVDFESLPLALVLSRMERTVKTSLVLLDACRDNPLARNLVRSMGTRGVNIGQGLAEVKTGIGTLISFSTQPGNVAHDGDGRNSPYTAALLKEIERPGRDILTTLAAVRGRVVNATRGKQVPWEHTSLLGPVVLKDAPTVAAPSTLELTPPTAAQSAAAEAWPTARDSNSTTGLEAFIRRFGDTYYGDLARQKLEEVKNAESERQKLVLLDQQRQQSELEARKSAEADAQRKAAEAKAAANAAAKSQKLENAQKAEAERQRIVSLDQQRKQDALRQKAETEAKKKAEIDAKRPAATAGTNVLMPPAPPTGPNLGPEQALPEDWLPFTMANLRIIKPNAEYGYWIEGISIAAVPRFENMIINRTDDISSMTCEASCRNDKGCLGAYYVRLVRGNDQCVLLRQLPPLMYVGMMKKNTISNSKIWLKPKMSLQQKDVLSEPAKEPDPGIGGCEGLPGEKKVWVSPFGPDQCWQRDRNLLSYRKRQQ